MHALNKGLLAGAVGTVALNIVTYGDMLVRGRPSSDTPAEVADVLADRTGVALGQGERKSHVNRPPVRSGGMSPGWEWEPPTV